MQKIRRFRWVWGFLGFLGVQGFSYFETGDVFSLFWFSFFGFFAYFWVGVLAREMPDERMVENCAKAKQNIAPIPLVLLFVAGMLAGLPNVNKEILVLFCALGYAATLVTYATLFWFYDKH